MEEILEIDNLTDTFHSLNSFYKNNFKEKIKNEEKKEKEEEK